jgi:Flp pilus assembly protein TadB
MQKVAQETSALVPQDRVEPQQLREMSTPALVRQAMSEVKLLAKAEMQHARLELNEELRQARTAGILLGCCAALLLCGASVAFVGVALALPISETAAAFIVGGFLLLTAAVCGAIGYRRLPKKPMQKTQQRIKEDLSVARKQLA